MALENTAAKYEVQIQRTGDGAAVAAKEFVQLDNTVKTINQSTTRTATNFREMDNSARAASSSLRLLNGVAMATGSQALTTMTFAAVGAKDAFVALKDMSRATGVSLGTIGVVIASVTAALYAASQAWDFYKLKQEEAASGDRLSEQQTMLRKRLLDQMEELQEAGKMTGAEVQSMLEAADKDLVGVIRKVQQIAGTKDQIEALKKLDDLRNQLTADSLDGLAKERFEAQINFQERRQQILDLAKIAGPKFTKESLFHIMEGNESALRADSARIEIQRGAKEIEQFEQQLKITALESSETRIEQAQREFAARTQLYAQLAADGKATEEDLTKRQRDAVIALLEAQREATQAWRQLGQQVEQSFSGGMSSAIVSFVSQTQSAKAAFSEFAASFLKDVAKMILEMEVLVALKALVSGVASSFTGGASSIDPGGELKLAKGGVVFAANGLAGMVSSPVYMPKFNVVAGEAGAEMLTVLARPRFMNVGGVSAVVGQAGSKTLAVTNASSLGGAGGKVDINISLEQGLRADIVNQSVANAEIRITQRAKQSSPLREAIKEAAR